MAGVALEFGERHTPLFNAAVRKAESPAGCRSRVATGDDNRALGSILTVIQRSYTKLGLTDKMAEEKDEGLL